MAPSNLIDMDLWNRAHWKGVAFRAQEGALPVLALVFADQDAVETIMKGWHDLLGEQDRFEVVRIAIIEAAAVISGSNEIVLDESHRMGKTQIALRRASDIGANDTDRVVFTRDEARGARWN